MSILRFIETRLMEDLHLAAVCTPDHEVWQAFSMQDVAGCTVYDDQWRLLDGVWYDHNEPLSNKPGATGPAYVNSDRIVEHAARHDPARTRREVTAKRRLIEVILQREAKIDGEWGCCHSAIDIAAGNCSETPLDQIEAFRALASVWSDHPDYRPEWATDLHVS